MFGDNLKKYRRNKGLSQNDLAEKLFVTRQCVSKWEKGVTQPDLQTLTKLSELLEVSIDILIKEDHGLDQKNPDHKNVCFLIANILTAAFCFIAFIVIWRFLPQTIPAHWTHGVIDRYGSRNEIFINMITTAVFFAADMIVFFVMKRVSDKRIVFISYGVIILFQTAYLVFLIALYAEYLNNILSFITCMSADLIMCVSAAMHPKISKKNYLLGVRTTETLNSPYVWKKANALACYLFTGCSLIILIMNLILIFKLSCLCLLSYIILAIAVILYAGRLGKTSGDNKR